MKKHIFAFYVQDLSRFLQCKKQGDLFSFKDADLWNRLTKVVRLRANDQFVLFDEIINTTLIGQSDLLDKKRMVVGKISEIEVNKKLTPDVTLAVGLLKKDAWEQVSYYAAQMGATTIVPIVSEKVQRGEWDHKKDCERMHKILIAACEQSKNFVFPEICKPKVLLDFLRDSGENKKIKKIYFDEHAASLFNLLKDINEQNYQEITLLIGCEGGFSETEISSIKDAHFSASCLTPTVLRSVEAVAVGLGVIRSVTSRSVTYIKE